ncbi:unnamed protein product [Acanthoscelides obtectus]|uniref:Pre-C2HC domain-containing protein n=1 Tax=Acanthoscelides obtectus TaxID=200917 RepID=A0A9P0M2Z9_ACAOB|nr:unnamed protein product [Acanthoscelides obtectus]CAK1663855.1 hypothetical protein AOBTE_LOCUS23900 [Acanthoscelides obtectus]
MDAQEEGTQQTEGPKEEEAEKRTDDTDFSVATRRRKRVRVSSEEEDEEPRQRKMPAATKKSGPRATRTTEAPMAGTGVPPINIEGTADWSSLSRMMNSKGIQFSKARTAGTSVKVFTNTPADYRQLVALLESIKRPFFTYQLKEDRMDQRVIRGLPREMSVNDIKEDLVSQGIADAVVQQLTSRTTKKPLPLFLVKTKMPEKLAEIQRLAMLTARTAGNSVKVSTNTPADYRQLVALLDSMKRPFFTYQLKEDKMNQRVVRGLPRKMSTEDIKKDLVNQGVSDTEVQQMTSRTTKKPLPLFLVKTKMPEKLLEIQKLAMLTVSFERKKKSTEPSQCYR